MNKKEPKKLILKWAMHIVNFTDTDVALRRFIVAEGIITYINGLPSFEHSYWKRGTLPLPEGLLRTRHVVRREAKQEIGHAGKQEQLKGACKLLVERMLSLRKRHSNLVGYVWVEVSDGDSFMSKSRSINLCVYTKQGITFEPIYFVGSCFYSNTTSENQFRKHDLGETAYNFMLGFKARIKRELN